MPTPARVPRLSYTEYRALEERSDERHTWLAGEVFAMAGGSPTHARIAMDLAVLLAGQLGDGPCQPFGSDLRVRVPETGLATYPDLSIICGPLELHPEDDHAVTNPVVLIEILSKSTEAWDRGDKFAHYRRLVSLQEYVLVAQDKKRVEHYRRNDDGTWTLAELGAGGALTLSSLGCAVDVDRIYARTQLPPTASPGA